MLPLLLANIEIQRHYQNESKFNGFCSQNNLPKTIKDGVYEVNLSEHKSIGTNWVILFCVNGHIL